MSFDQHFQAGAHLAEGSSNEHESRRAGKRSCIGFQYFAGALGIALAVAAVVALGGWRSDSTSSPNAAAAARPARILIVGPREQPYTVFAYYLVNSEEQRDSVLKHEADLVWSAISQPQKVPRRAVQIVITPSTEDLRLLEEAVRGIGEFGNGAEVIDLRSR